LVGLRSQGDHVTHAGKPPRFELTRELRNDVEAAGDGRQLKRTPEG